MHRPGPGANGLRQWLGRTENASIAARAIPGCAAAVSASGGRTRFAARQGGTASPGQDDRPFTSPVSGPCPGAGPLAWQTVHDGQVTQVLALHL